MAFNAILHGTEAQYKQYSNVVENYNYYRGLIDAENFQTILNGIDRLYFVEISLERGKDDPQRIFESLNSTGLALTQSDLIRNYILMDKPPREQQKLFDEIWHPIEQNARNLVRQRSMVSDFIRDFLTLRNKKIPNKNMVYEEFKQIYFDKKDENFKQELEIMKSLSVHYNKFTNPGEEKNEVLRKHLNYIG